jgi:hypothetical protein
MGESVMGYSTDFEGELLFKDKIDVEMIMTLGNMMGEDCRDHPEWEVEDPTYTSMDLELAYGDSVVPYGIRWDGSEKTYNMDAAINVIITEMRKLDPDFTFKGEMYASGEEDDDRWKIVICDDGFAKRIDGEVTVVYEDE